MAIQPRHIEGMMIVGITNGTGHALFEQVNIVDGQVQDGNVDTYRVIRMSEAPDIEVAVLTGKYRKGKEQPDSLRRKILPKAMSDEGSLDAIEQLIPLAQSAGISLMHMALAFVVAHPALTCAIIGPRTMEQLDGLLAGAEVVLDDELLDRIDEIVPPGVDVAPLEAAAYLPPSIAQKALRRRPITERAAT